MLQSKNGILKDLVISSKLQAEIDQLYLVFLVNTLTIATDKLTKSIPSQEWFAREIWRVSDNLWPGTNRTQQTSLIMNVIHRTQPKDPTKENK